MSTDADIDEQRAGTELRVPECLATTPKMKEYAIDLVMRTAVEKRQKLLDDVKLRNENGENGNPISLLKSLVGDNIEIQLNYISKPSIQIETSSQILNIPACLATTKMMQNYTVDLVEKLPINAQQNILDSLDHYYVEGMQGLRERMVNPIGFLKELIKREQSTFSQGALH